jgi:hypothetical protein
MGKILIKWILSFAVLILPLPLPAQTGSLRANIPFQFVVGKQRMPAGYYEIAPKGDAGQLLLLRHRDGNRAVMPLTHRIEGIGTDRAGKLIFHRYGDRYFLSQVWFSGLSAARELTPSKLELELARSGQSETAVLKWP